MRICSNPHVTFPVKRTTTPSLLKTVGLIFRPLHTVRSPQACVPKTGIWYTLQCCIVPTTKKSSGVKICSPFIFPNKYRPFWELFHHHSICASPQVKGVAAIHFKWTVLTVPLEYIFILTLICLCVSLTICSFKLVHFRFPDFSGCIRNEWSDYHSTEKHLKLVLNSSSGKISWSSCVYFLSVCIQLLFQQSQKPLIANKSQES